MLIMIMCVDMILATPDQYEQVNCNEPFKTVYRAVMEFTF